MTENNKGTLELKLANSKSVVSSSGVELACFLESGGSSIVPNTRKKGCKSKGACNKGKSKATKVA